MGRLTLVLLLAACLAACIEAPTRPLTFEPPGPPKGLPLDASDTIAVFVLQAAGPPSANHASHPISQTGTMYRELAAAFRTVRPDAKIVEADVALRDACFSGATAVVYPSEVLLATPDPRSDPCRALVEARKIAYLVTVGGQRETQTINEVEIPGPSIMATSTHMHYFRLLARVIETTTGANVCEEADFQYARSGQGFATFWFVIPIPVGRVLDESAYWTNAAARVGRLVGWCFASPG